MASDSILKYARLARNVIALDGDAAEQGDFLQSLLTNDITKARADHLVYAALQTPQGKFLADMLVGLDPAGNYRLDVAAELAADVLKRLTMYRLRRPITLAKLEMPVFAVWGEGTPPQGAARDPRNDALGWRFYNAEPSSAPGDYDLHRLQLGIPEAPADLIPNDTFLLEAGFEALHGVDFKKGCYVGQEIVARMKHKTTLRKGYRPVAVIGSAKPGTAITNAEGRDAGTLYSNRDGFGIALIRQDRAEGALAAGDDCTVRMV